MDAVLLTHEHSDHVKGLPTFCRRNPGIPVYATRMTRRIVAECLDNPIDWRVIPGNGSFALGEFEVSTFPIPHDAIEPLGFVLRKGPTQLGMLTDAGHITETIKTRLSGSHGLFVEANYDPELLEVDTRRPWAVKQRIMGLHGHLSNAQAVELIRELSHAGLQHIVCGHLSSDCNTPCRVLSAVEDWHTENGNHSPSLLVSERDKPTPLLRIRGTRAPESARESTPPAGHGNPHAVQGELFGVL